jgi:hypothetical protein
MIKVLGFGLASAVVLLGACGGSSPTDGCNKIAAAICAKFYQCIDAQTIKTTLGYTSQDDCTIKLEAQGNCANYTCAQGRTYNASAADTCANDLNNEACNQATQTPPSCNVNNICQ